MQAGIENASSSNAPQSQQPGPEFRSLRSAVMDSVTARPTSVQVPVERVTNSIGLAPSQQKNSKPAAAAAAACPVQSAGHHDVLDGGAGRTMPVSAWRFLMLQLVK